MNAALAKEFSESAGVRPENKGPFKSEPEADKSGAGMLKECFEEIEKQARLGNKTAKIFYGIWNWPEAELKKLGYEVNFSQLGTGYDTTIITW